MLSSSLTINSWRGIRALHGKILLCRKSTGLSLRLPWTEEDWLAFTTWLASTVSASSTKSYVNRINTLHGILGHGQARPQLVSRLVTGLENSQLLEKQAKPARSEISPEMLRELRGNLRAMKWPMSLKRLIWCCITWMYIGKNTIHQASSDYNDCRVLQSCGDLGHGEAQLSPGADSEMEGCLLEDQVGGR